MPSGESRVVLDILEILHPARFSGKICTKGKVNPSPWFVCSRSSQNAETRLFLFPYAGGGPAVFNTWYSNTPETIESWIAHYPGRGSRYSEPPIKKISTLVEQLSLAIQPHVDKPYIFFGHSLGGLVAFELTRQLRRQNQPQPQILFVSACSAPHLPDPHSPIHALPETEFLKSLGQLNGIPSEVSNQPEVMKLLLPVLRADFEIVENYAYSADTPLDCPIIAYSGLDDPRVNQEHIEGWVLHTNSKFKSQYFPGDHFFINSAREALINSIISEMTAVYAKD
jgi:medium-chain acyl-[acyl-carrier-protein] hydrolase